MAITRGAKKAIRVSQRKKVFNDRRAKTMKDTIKSVRQLFGCKNPAKPKTFLSVAYSAIDKARKRGVIKKTPPPARSRVWPGRLEKQTKIRQ